MKKAVCRTDDDEFFIVLVDRMRFESVWFKGGDRVVPELARGNELVWRKDYKFHLAEKGFSHGIKNPVGLACLQANSQYPQVSFTDGITRTIWLLANGASLFPVFTYSRSTANNSHLYIGARSSCIISNNELFDKLNQTSYFKMV